MVILIDRIDIYPVLGRITTAADSMEKTPVTVLVATKAVDGRKKQARLWCSINFADCSHLHL
jgi:hypothetical protein